MAAVAAFERRVEPRWLLASRPDPARLASLREGLKIPRVMAKILINRGIDEVGQARDFLYPSLDHLLDPFGIRDMAPAVSPMCRQAGGNRADTADREPPVGTSTGCRRHRSWYPWESIESRPGCRRPG